MNQLKTFKKQKKGITLIALVITIIVLLILAAVSIATLTGQNGILTKAQESKEKSETAQKDEEAKLAQAEANMNFGDTKYNDVTIPTGMTPTRKEGESTVDEGLVAIDQNGNEWVWIEVPKSAMPQETITFVNPTGYSDEDETQCTKIETSLRTYAKKYAGGTYEQGYVWKDKWYAVDENDIVITESTATDDKQRQLSNGCGLTLKEYKEKYQKMLKSVYTNGGFWIGRYEAGIKGTRGTGQESFELARKYGDDISTTQIVIQKDAIVCNYVTCSQAQILSSNLSPDSTKTTSLMFGIQWDLVCMFLESKNALTQDDINKDSGSWGNYSDNDLKITSEKAKGHFYKASNDARWDIISGYKKKSQDNDNYRTLLSSGASNTTEKLNIYDFAGNLEEWTLEYSDSERDAHYCILRGGDFFKYGDVSSAAVTSNASITYEDVYIGFRPTLY